VNCAEVIEWRAAVNAKRCRFRILPFPGSACWIRPYRRVGMRIVFDSWQKTWIHTCLNEQRGTKARGNIIA